MNKLKINHWLCVLAFILCVALFQGCNRGRTSSHDAPQYSFIEPMQVVEVDAETKSFRIIVERVRNHKSFSFSVPVYLDTVNTTARHDKHFINHVDVDTLSPYPEYSWNIGDFTPMDTDEMFYRDVELIPENIINEVSIFYYMGNVDIELNDRLEVILKPKNK